MNRRTEDGAAVVEFALILVPFLVIIFGLIQYGVYFWAAQTGSHATNSAVRELSVGHCTDSVELKTYVENQLKGSAKTGTTTVATQYLNPDSSVPTSPQAQNVQVGGQVKLTVTFQSLDLHFPLLPFPKDGKVTRTVDARVEYVPSAGCGA